MKLPPPLSWTLRCLASAPWRFNKTNFSSASPTSLKLPLFWTNWSSCTSLSTLFCNRFLPYEQLPRPPFPSKTQRRWKSRTIFLALLTMVAVALVLTGLNPRKGGLIDYGFGALKLDYGICSCSSDGNISFMFIFCFQQEEPAKTSGATCNSRGSVFGCVGLA